MAGRHPHPRAHDRGNLQDRAHEPAVLERHAELLGQLLGRRLAAFEDRQGAVIAGNSRVGDEEDSHLGDFIEDKNTILPIDAAIQSNLRARLARVLASRVIKIP